MRMYTSKYWEKYGESSPAAEEEQQGLAPHPGARLDDLGHGEPTLPQRPDAHGKLRQTHRLSPLGNHRNGDHRNGS